MYRRIETTIMTLREDADGRRLVSPAEVADLVKDLSSCAQEQFVVLTIDTKNRLIRRNMVALGTLNQTLVHPREVFRTAIIDSAAQIIVVHNHPSGDPSPSSNDIRITKKLIEAGRIIEIPVNDHVIIGRPDRSGARCSHFVSLREYGLCEFENK